MTMTDPIADMLTRLRNANTAYHDTVAMPSLARSRRTSPRSSSRRATSPAGASRTPRTASARRSSLDLKYGPNRERSIAGMRRISQARPAGVRQVDQPAARARRPGRRDHLDVHRPADRPAGRQEGRGRGSPRLRLVRGGADMSRIGRLPDPRALGRRREHRRPRRHGQGPQGHAVAHRRRADRDRPRRGRHPRGDPPQRRARRSRALHGLSRTLVANMVTGVTDGYTQESRDRRHRLPRRRPRAATSSSRSASATRSWSRRPRASPSRSRRRPGSRSSGIDKQKVGEVAANIRKLRKPDPYKGKGVRYAGRGHPPQGRKGW